MLTSTAFQDEANGVYENLASVDASESTSVTTPSITTTPSVTTTTTTVAVASTAGRNAETTHDSTIYSDTFLAGCAELAEYDDSVRREEDPTTTWLSQVRRRCLNIRNWLPKMCSCLETGTMFSELSGLSNRSVTRVGSYERLGSRCNAFEFSRTMTKTRTRYDRYTDDYDDENYHDDGGGGDYSGEENGHGDGENRIEELRFHNDDHTWNSLIVEKNLRTIDLCQLLKVKRNVSGIAWSIVETWPHLGIERTLEDHEDILAVHREMKMFASRHHRKFFFRPDFLKYEFFLNPKQFFPTDMVAFPTTTVAIHKDGGTSMIDAESALRNFLMQDDAECPQVFSLVWIRFRYLDVWRKMYMLLRERKLYVTNKINAAATLASSKRILPDNGQLTPVAHLSDYAVYRITNAKKRFNAPFEWGVCLRPSCKAEAESTEAGESGLKVIAFHSEKSRVCWLTAMRLAKYGKQLRENYRAFKNKQCEQTSGDSPKERYTKYDMTNETVRSRVAMDFTGSVGRIVDDPKEAKDIAECEGINWRRTWRPFSRPPAGCAVLRLHGLDDGIHVLQPWFHRGLKRDIAAAIVRDHGSVDGVFLVRESRSNLGAYVLTYKYSEKVFHAQIQPVFDERCNCWLYTLDKGVTKFYDLLQLIEFYQLNAGSLPTRLTHYVQNGVPVPVPRAEDGRASPSPPEACHRFVATACANPTSLASHGSI